MFTSPARQMQHPPLLIAEQGDLQRNTQEMVMFSLQLHQSSLNL